MRSLYALASVIVILYLMTVQYAFAAEGFEYIVNILEMTGCMHGAAEFLAYYAVGAEEHPGAINLAFANTVLDCGLFLAGGHHPVLGKLACLTNVIGMSHNLHELNGQELDEMGTAEKVGRWSSVPVAAGICTVPFLH